MLPVATEATVEHELKRLGNTELLNWNLEVAGLSLDRSCPLTSRLAPRLTPPPPPSTGGGVGGGTHGDAV